MKKIIALILTAVTLLALCACNGGGGDGGESVQRLYNAVVFVNFKDRQPITQEYALGRVEEMNGSPTGASAFFKAESLGRCEVTSYFAGVVDIDKNTTYYSYLDEWFKDEEEAFFREQLLIRKVCEGMTLPDGALGDGDGDGRLDAITFVLNAEFEAGEFIFWPHKSEFYEYREGDDIPGKHLGGKSEEEVFALPKVSGYTAGEYVIVPDGFTSAEVCHELTHVLGAPDYYPYDGRLDKSNIQGFELMGNNVRDIPQYSLAYVRAKLGWLKEGEHVKVITESDRITLSPVTAGGVQAIKIMPRDFASTGEYFMVEVRAKEQGKFDSAVNSSGVIVYAVNEQNAYIGPDGELGNRDYGNMYGEDMEVRFFYRSILGMPAGYFTGKDGADTTGELTFADGTGSGVTVEDITENADGSYTFNVSMESGLEGEYFSAVRNDIAGGAVGAVSWYPKDNGRTYVMAIAADGRSAAADFLKCLPSDRHVRDGNGEGYTVLYTDVLSSASQRYIPEVEEELFLITVSEDSSGKLYGRSVIHFTVGGREQARAEFLDVLAVLFMPGNPAFIASCVVVGLCVLVGITAFIYAKKKGMQGGKQAD